jgi:ATP-dependent helicase HrpB
VAPFPIDRILPELKRAVAGDRSVVLSAPPGAGKTTRVPLALLELIPPEKGRIVMLEPRRIAAVSAARWMARTLGEQVGETVGYSIRFESRISRSTRIEVVTEGVLVRRLQTDPGLEGVAMVIFDEFHERSLQADLALALCLDARQGLREDLAVVVMSATLDCGPVASLLGGAPIVSAEGRLFPVEERYLADRQMPLRERIADAVKTALGETKGDILVFLPGSGEIRACAETVGPLAQSAGAAVHPLYGDLPFEEQEHAILSSEKRKIVLATNIAETSLTIEGVSVVIDSGLTRRLQHDPSTGMNRLVTGMVSRASAEQRKGRAGRLGPGVCYRLYGRHVFQSLVPYALPEILVSDLSSLVLDLAVWGVKDPSVLRWLDPPPAAAWESGKGLLLELGALEPSGSATPAGSAMARLPLHPRLGRLVWRAKELGAPGLGADLASLLSERDMTRRGLSRRAWDEPDPDIDSRLGVLDAWRKGGEIPGAADPWALRAVGRTSDQLLRLMHADRRPSKAQGASPDIISRLLLCAFPDRIARLREDAEGRFVLATGRGVRMSPASAPGRSRYIVALNVDAGEKAEGTVHLAAPVSEEMIRDELGGRIERTRRVGWHEGEGRVVATVEEKIGAVLLSSKPFSPDDEEAVPLVCEAIRRTPGMLGFSKRSLQFQGRVRLIKRAYPGEEWPDLSAERLLSMPEEWLLPWLGGVRTVLQIKGLDVSAALRSRLSWEQRRLLDERAPESIVVPSGHHVPIDYAAGEVPVLAVKLQEMFGLADTPSIAGGRVKLLLHLLSPARRPVQITQDLKGFWNGAYLQVKKELKGRYPKHPWPDDPWNAAPTRGTKRRA